MSKRHSWKKIQTTFQVWIYFPEMTLTHFQKAIFGILAGFFSQEWRLPQGQLSKVNSVY